MIEPTLNYVSCDGPGGTTAGIRRMAYWQWGDAGNPHVVVCVHGLSRQGRDFDTLARHLCDEVRVICPDVAGRGQSDWLEDPMQYQIPAYASDMRVLLAHLHEQSPITKLDWIGTSMGGLIGMVVAGAPGGHEDVTPGPVALPVPVHKLVLNDVGPAIVWQAIERIALYLGKAGRFASFQAAADAMWAVSTSFGPHTPEEWLALSRHMVRPVPGDSSGLVELHYDPAIAVPVRATTEAATRRGEDLLWQLYDNIKAQTLVLRGAQSDLLSRETALAMTQRGPRARLVEFEGVGHAPTLVAAEQVDAVSDFLFV